MSVVAVIATSATAAGAAIGNRRRARHVGAGHKQGTVGKSRVFSAVVKTV